MVKTIIPFGKNQRKQWPYSAFYSPQRGTNVCGKPR